MTKLTRDDIYVGAILSTKGHSDPFIVIRMVGTDRIEMIRASVFNAGSTCLESILHDGDLEHTILLPDKPRYCIVDTKGDETRIHRVSNTKQSALTTLCSRATTNQMREGYSVSVMEIIDNKPTRWVEYSGDSAKLNNIHSTAILSTLFLDKTQMPYLAYKAGVETHEMLNGVPVTHEMICLDDEDMVAMARLMGCAIFALNDDGIACLV